MAIFLLSAAGVAERKGVDEIAGVSTEGARDAGVTGAPGAVNGGPPALVVPPLSAEQDGANITFDTSIADSIKLDLSFVVESKTMVCP